MRSRLLAVGLMAVFVGITALAQTKPAPTAPPKTAPQTASKTGPAAPPTTDAEMIKSALSAAPAAIAKDATVVDMSMKVLKQGTNGWTCLPDMPSTPGPDPMCVDKNGMEWAAAWMGHKDPPKDKMALAYMLVGATDPSNTDPFAEKPADGKWIVTGPHMMLLNIGDHFAGYPTTATNTKVPYVMFPNTPYAHLMIPIK
jgi:hypothetical protein